MNERELSFSNQISDAETATAFSHIIHDILSSSSIFIAVESATELCILFTPDNGKQYGALISFSIAEGHLLAKVSKKSIYQTMYLGGCFTFDADDFVQDAARIARLETEQSSFWISEDDLIENAGMLVNSAQQLAQIITSY